jgi:hypothetical protein
MIVLIIVSCIFTYLLIGYAFSSSIAEIHVELIHEDVVYAKLLTFLEGHRGLLLALLTPVNYEFCQTNVGLNMTKEQYTEILTERYLTLKNFTARFSIHVHFCYPSYLLQKYYSYQKQFEMIKEAKEFFESLGLPTTDFTPGWFVYNNDTILACHNLGIANFHTEPTGTYSHDYSLP